MLSHPFEYLLRNRYANHQCDWLASLRRRTNRKRAWRVVNGLVALATIANVSLAGVLIAPTKTAMADVTSGNIIVHKQFDTNGDGVADLTGPDALLADWTFTVTDGQTSADLTTDSTGLVNFPVINGTYSVTETGGPDGFHFVSASCTKLTAAIGDVDTTDLAVQICRSTAIQSSVSSSTRSYRFN